MAGMKATAAVCLWLVVIAGCAISQDEPTALTLEPLPQHIEVTAASMSVLSEPGDGGEVVATLQRGATALAGIGPIVLSGHSWYHVFDDTGGAPEYQDGWVDLGTATDSSVVESLGWDGPRPYVYHVHGTGTERHGPIQLGDESGLVWAAAGDGCQFELAGVDADGHRTELASRVVDGVATEFSSPGQLPADMRGDVRLVIESDCAWAVGISEAPAG